MKTLLLKMLVLTAAISACSTMGFTQSKKELLQIPEGKWVLNMEYVETANGGCSHNEDSPEASENHVHTKADLSGVELYPELQIKGNDVLIKSSKNSLKAKYIVFDDEMEGFYFDSPTVPFSPGAKLVDNMLYVQQRVADPLNKANIRYISLRYELKK